MAEYPDPMHIIVVSLEESLILFIGLSKNLAANNPCLSKYGFNALPKTLDISRRLPLVTPYIMVLTLLTGSLWCS